ncbi:hypothetical protein [Succinivibrio sp.]|uniref:hypothetical protein n=1 Tax=Succinivibrio sp. TaxID=2053619 RepID=UPI0025FF04AA|nr:hypothetical protein [Succinivibrio sp.]MBQ9220053.1 hypothetical protein [Succinivibrio sp.]
MTIYKTFKIHDVKGNLTQDLIEDRIKGADPDYRDTNFDVYEKGKNYVDLELDDEEIKKIIKKVNQNMKEVGYEKLIEENELTKRRYCLILDYIFKDTDAPYRKKILQEVYTAIECELEAYIGVKNGDTENYYCDKYKEIQNTPKI